MFIELLPILRNRPLMLTLALVDANAIRVNVIPKRLKDGDSGDDALTTPLTVTGTPDELDREFASQLVGFTGAFVKLGSNLAELEVAHATAVKAVEAEKTVAEVQGDIDTQRAELAAEKTRVATSKITLDYTAVNDVAGIFGALGAILPYLLPIGLFGGLVAWIVALGNRKSAPAAADKRD